MTTTTRAVRLRAVVATAVLGVLLTGTVPLSPLSSHPAPAPSGHPMPALSPTSSTPSGLPAGNWTMKFRDEFSGTSLNTRKWGTRYPWGTQLNTGTTETECYEPSALTEGSGKLTITATRQQDTCQGKTQVTEPYTSGMIQSRPSFTFTYGYSEIRAKLPGATSTWPAFWQVPADRRWPPSLDVFEGWGQHGRHHHLDRVTQTDIWRGGQHRTQLMRKDFTRTWHTYGVAWKRHSITFYLDGVATARYRAHVPSTPMYVVANLAMQSGSATSGPRSAALRIDYIRVYQRS